jgi:hypothetical protein
LGELRKLGVKAVSRNTVKNILKVNGLEPSPERSAGTWDEFLKIHAATLWQCDFFSKRVLTVRCFRDLYLLVLLHVETGQAFIAPSTFHPHQAWVKDQAGAFLKKKDHSPPDVVPVSQIPCRQRLGGLLKRSWVTMRRSTFCTGRVNGRGRTATYRVIVSGRRHAVAEGE